MHTIEIADEPFVLPLPAGPLGEAELALLDAYWRSANYLSVGLDGVAANLVSSIVAPLPARSAGGGPEAGREPEPGVVLLDLSGLSNLDDLGLSALHQAVIGLRSRGWRVERSDPNGPSLTLLDSAAWAGWIPPKLTCTDVLHWQPRSAGTKPAGSCGCG